MRQCGLHSTPALAALKGNTPTADPPPTTQPHRPTRASAEVARSFLAATARGYAHAADHPTEAADALVGYVERRVAAGEWPPLAPPLEAEMVRESAAAVAPHLLSEASGKWGHMEMDRCVVAF